MKMTPTIIVSLQLLSRLLRLSKIKKIKLGSNKHILKASKRTYKNWLNAAIYKVTSRIFTR